MSQHAEPARTRSAVPLAIAKVAVLLGLVFTAVQGVLVPRGLYADGAYNLWLVLNDQSFVIIEQARALMPLLNQLPVLAGMKLGINDLDVLIGLYSLGVASFPVLIWLLALIVQWNGLMFWPLVVVYSATFLNAGFVAIGEYNFAFALVGLSIALLLLGKPIKVWHGVTLVIASLLLTLSYEGMSFLAFPLIALTFIRIRKSHWLAVPVPRKFERWILWFAFIAFCVSSLVAIYSILQRSLNSADTNLAGAANLMFPIEYNRQWQLSFAVAVLLMATALLRKPLVRGIAQLLLIIVCITLFWPRIWTPAWLHYNTRSLTAISFFFLLVLAIVVVLVFNKRLGVTSTVRISKPEPYRSLTFGLVASLLFLSLSTAFWYRNYQYGLWLHELQDTVIARTGLIDITTTDLYAPEKSQFSWGWTNPYLSALLQTEFGQGILLSHVEKAEDYAGLMPPSSTEFFEIYDRKPAG